MAKAVPEVIYRQGYALNALVVFSFQQFPAGQVIFIAAVVMWDALWKPAAFWRSAKNDHLGWFICIAVFNTAGILPIIYLLTHKKEYASGS